MRATGVAEYEAAPGHCGVWMLRETLTIAPSFAMFPLWDSLEAVRAFAGAHDEAAVFYPKDERFLIERDLRERTYAVIEACDA